jgi:hypothetical protein
MKRLTYDDMRKSLILDYETKGNKGLKKYKSGEPWGLKHLDGFFKGTLARSINTDAIHRYIKDRKKTEGERHHQPHPRSAQEDDEHREARRQARVPPVFSHAE